MSFLSNLAYVVNWTDESARQSSSNISHIAAMAEAVPVPEPPGLPLIGNLAEFTTSPLKDIGRLADTYG